MNNAERVGQEFHFTNQEFLLIAKLLKEHTGIDLADHKKDMAYARLSRRIRELGLTSFKAYIALLDGPGGEQEIGHLVNSMTTNLTHFFREQHHFDHLGAVSLPDALERIKDGKQKRLRIWSAGCSTGQEAYSITMVLRDRIANFKTLDARVLATDLDTVVLNTASQGVYSAESVLQLSDLDRLRHFKPLGNPETDDWKVRSSLRDMIVFNQLNLLEEWPMEKKFDIIFCRNVMIYFDRETTKNLLERFHRALRPGGWLYIGHSETMRCYTDLFEHVGTTTHRKREDA